MNEKAEVKKAILGAYFQGEYWIICPHCGRSFEYYDAVYEREGIKRAEKDIYTCICGGRFKI